MKLPDLDKIDFHKVKGLIPCIVQDDQTNVVLMLGYMNKEALQQTVLTKKVTFYSRTKKRLWTKGETSGNFLEVKSLKLDCDKDALLIKAKPAGPVCHKGADTCFNEKNEASFIKTLQAIIEDRKANPKSSSYTNKLFKKGVNKIAQKFGEEAFELVIEAKDDDDKLFLNEAADLLYHYIVLLVNRGYKLEDVEKVLHDRHK